MSIKSGYMGGSTGGGGAPSYTHWRWRVTDQLGITDGWLCSCDSAESGSRDVSFYFDTSLGDGDGFYLYGGNDYIVVTEWHTHPSFPGDTPNVGVEIRHASQRADEGTPGVCDPFIGGPINDNDTPLELEACYSDGTRDDD